MDGPEKTDEAEAAAAAAEDEEWEHVAQPPSQKNTGFPPGAHERRLHPHSCPRHLDAEEEEEVEEEKERRWMRWVYSGLGMVYSRIVPATLQTRRPGGGGLGFPFPSLAAVVVLMGFLMCQRRRHRREKELLDLLNKANDKRIRQLLDQIAVMNEVIAPRSRVPILRRF